MVGPSKIFCLHPSSTCIEDLERSFVVRVCTWVCALKVWRNDFCFSPFDCRRRGCCSLRKKVSYHFVFEEGLKKCLIRSNQLFLQGIEPSRVSVLLLFSHNHIFFQSSLLTRSDVAFISYRVSFNVRESFTFLPIFFTHTFQLKKALQLLLKFVYVFWVRNTIPPFLPSWNNNFCSFIGS